MSLDLKILGSPRKDNALFVKLNSGRKIITFLFDCGEDTLKKLSFREIRGIDYLFFSHFHLDHASGFDYFLRRNYDRHEKPVRIFGPPGTIDIITHRLRSFTWNLNSGIPGEWYISEPEGNVVKTVKLKPSDGFSVQEFMPEKILNSHLINEPEFSVKYVTLDHIIPSFGYSVTESERYNIDKEELQNGGFVPGGWLDKIKSPDSGDEKIDTGNGIYQVKELKEKLVTKESGKKVVYLTDFIFSDINIKKSVEIAESADFLVCEAQYNSEHITEAKKNYHLLSSQSAEIAKTANVKKLILFHVSDRYSFSELKKTLSEAKEVFPNTYFPEEWNI